MNLFWTYIIFLFFFFPSLNYAQLVPDFRVNQVPATLNLLFPRVDIDGQGNFIIVWTDRRLEIVSNRVLLNIYCQRYNYNAEALGENFRVNINLDTANAPTIAVQKSGRFSVCWKELNSGWNNLYLRLYDHNGFPLTTAVKLSDTIGGIENPAMSVSQKGIYIITWRHRVNTNQPYKILYQKIDSLGNKIGQNVRVDDYENSNKERPAITIRKDGSFIITWDDQRIPGGNPHVFMQMFDPDGKPLGANQQVNEITGPIDSHTRPKISSDSSGNFIIAWFDSRGGLFPDVRSYAQAYNANGEKVGNNFRLLETINPARNVIVKLEDGRYFFGSDHELSNSYWRALCQRFDSSNVKIGGVYALSNQVPGTNQDYQDVKAFGDRIISVWLDRRNGPADVYCNIRSFQNPDSVLSNVNIISNEIPESFELFQNYPNPFNPVTNVRFRVSKFGFIQLKIYDIMGREIATLVSQNLYSGEYNYELRIMDHGLSSGIYFYTLEASDSATKELFFKETKKAVILK